MRKSYFFWHKKEQRACLSYPWRVVNFRGHRQSSHSTFPLTSAKQLLTSSIIRNPSGGLKVIRHFKKCKIDSRAVPFQNKTTENLKKCHQIVQIDVWYGGKLSEQYRELFSELERSFQPAYYRYAVYFHGGFNPIKNISKEKNTDWQILLSLQTCCSSRFIFRPGNPFPVTDPEGWN